MLSVLKENSYLCYRIIRRIMLRIIRRLNYIWKLALYPLILQIGRRKEPIIDKNKSVRTVKVLHNKSRASYTILKRYFNTEKGWMNIEFTTDRYADYYFIMNHPLDSFLSYYNPKRTLLYFSEPLIARESFMRSWKNFNEEDFFYISKTPHRRMFTIWYLSKSYHWLKENSICKTKMFSTIISSWNLFPVHKKRLQFVTMLDEQISIDIYGKVNRFRSPLKACSQYRGELPVDMEKDKGLFPYKYHFASESCIEDNYITEKLTDAILAECLCFYYGTKTAKDWIDSEAFIHIDIMRPAEAISLIKKAIENKEWEKRIHIIRKEKQKILDEMLLLADIKRVIDNNENYI